jgi:hypothetical protein
MQTLLTNKKAMPFLNSTVAISFQKALDNLQKHASRFNFNYLLMMGEYDWVVNNRLSN